MHSLRNLFAPFGISSSGYVWNDALAALAARPHNSDGKPLTKKQPNASAVARYGSAGGLQTTSKDYAKFLVEIVDPQESDEFRLSQQSLREMLRPQVKLGAQDKIDDATSWALGWAIQERKTGNVIVHSGGQEGFRSLAMGSVERKSGFILLTNGDSGGRVIYNPRLAACLNPLLAA